MIDIQKLRALEQRLPGDQWYCPEDLDGEVLADGTVESDGSWYPSRRIESEARWESDGGTRVETTELGEFDTPALAADVCEMRNALPDLLDEIERLRKVGSEMVNAIEQWANGEAGWSTRLRAAQEAARPVLGMGLACRKPTEDFDAERRARG